MCCLLLLPRPLRYFGQWMALHVPFQKLDDLLVPEIVTRVPEHVKFLACALHWAPQVWRNEAAIQELMALRAHKDAQIRTILEMIRTQAFFVDQHLSGHMECTEAAVQAEPPLIARSYFEDEDGLQLTAEQKRLADNINQRVDQALRARTEADEEAMEKLLGLIEEHGSMVSVSGQPGTGRPPC